MPVYGLIGYPLTHSFSKAYFTAKFEKEGLVDFNYINCEIENLDELKSIIQIEKILGFNVTIPFKIDIIPFLDSIDEQAKKIGSVNTVVVDEQFNLKGFNTDYIGFYETIKPLLKSNHTHAFILGSGGSSKTVAFVLDELGIDYKIITRNPIAFNHISYGHLTAIDLRATPLIINCTPIGMFPEINRFPDIPYDGIEKLHLLIDLIYNPIETVFLRNGRERGATTMNGYSMLIRQAEEAWKIWQK